MSEVCSYKQDKKKSDAYETAWVGSCGNCVTTETGDYGVIYKPTFNYCPHCGGKIETQS